MQKLDDFKLPNFFNYPPYFTAGSLSHEAREAFLSSLVAEGRAEWMDKGRRKCLVLWHRIQEWAEIILNFVKDYGLEDSVMTIEVTNWGGISGNRASWDGPNCANASTEALRKQGETCLVLRNFH